MNLKGKQLSLMSKIFALIFILAVFVAMAFTPLTVAIDDAIKVSIFIALVFSPVDISLICKTFLGSMYSRGVANYESVHEPSVITEVANNTNEQTVQVPPVITENSEASKKHVRKGATVT